MLHGRYSPRTLLEQSNPKVFENSFPCISRLVKQFCLVLQPAYFPGKAVRTG
jgi:hypothetical protein